MWFGLFLCLFGRVVGIVLGWLFFCFGLCLILIVVFV